MGFCAGEAGLLGACPHFSDTLLVAALTVLIASLSAPHAQQGAPGPPPKPLVPVAATTLTAHPDAYYGEVVTVTALVDEILAPTVFTVVQRAAGGAVSETKSNGQKLLILVPVLYGAVDPHAYVTVIGEVLHVDPDEIARKVKDDRLRLAPDLVEKYRGRPAVLATAVIDAAFIDLAKRLPPPMTAEEEAYSKIMRRVGPAFAALRKGIEGSSADLATENAVVLKQAFTEVEAFWKTKRKGDAARWAQDARRQVESIERTVTLGNWALVKDSAGTLGQACQTCHSTYRERFDDGSFRFKLEAKRSGRGRAR